jgi:hypothetical protein
MKTSAECPSCKAKITIVRVMMASTPVHLKCGKCASKLRVRGPVGIGVSVVGLALAGVLVYFILQKGGREVLVPALIGLFVYELIASILVIGWGRIEPR